MPHQTVLMVVDDEYSNHAIEEMIRESDYTVRMVRDLPGALESLAKASPSVIVICGPTAPDVCRVLRPATQVPILVLLPAGREDQMVKSLEAGADDCQCAAMGKSELMLRLRALLRRYDWAFAPLSKQPLDHPGW